MSCVQSISDFVAFSGQRDHTVIAPTVTRAKLNEAILATFVNGGWELIETKTPDTFGPRYVFRSQQSPWYDCDNIPDWYEGNKVIVEIRNNNGTFIQYYLAVDYNGTRLHDASSVFNLRVSLVQDYNFHFFTCPYQHVFWSDNLSTGTQQAETELLISALNLPKIIQQKNRIVHCVFATNKLRANRQHLGVGNFVTNGQDYCVYGTYNGSVSSDSYVVFNSGGSGIRFLVPQSTITSNDKTGRRIWNRGLDTTMADPTKWSPFFIPAYAIFPLPPFDSDNVTINGFLWDAIVVSEGFNLNSKITIPSELGTKTWEVFASGVNGDNIGGALFFNIDEIS